MIKIPSFLSEEKQDKLNPIENLYIKHANSSFKHLTEVYQGKCIYCYDDISQLINTLERYYKGFLSFKNKIDETYNLPKYFLTADHNLNKLVDRIEQTYSLFNCNSQYEYNERRRYLNELSKLYTTSRYQDFIEYEEYKEHYKFVQSQKDKILSYIDLETQKQNNKKNINFSNIKQELEECYLNDIDIL